MVLFGVGLQMGLPTESYYATIAIMDIAVAMTNAILFWLSLLLLSPRQGVDLRRLGHPETPISLDSGIYLSS